MQELSKAIYNKFTEIIGSNHNDFYNALGGRLFKELAPQNAAYPRASYHFITDRAEWSFQESYENVLVQFNIFDKDEFSSSVVEDAFSKLKALYDWVELSVTGYHFLLMMREFSILRQDPDRIWVYTTQYRIIVDKL